MIQAEIISVGDELLTGIVVNTNAAYIGQKLTELGYQVSWITTVGDNKEKLASVLEEAYNRASLIVVTGGLGPTHDDITKKVVAEFFDSKIIFKPDILSKIEERFNRMGREMAEVNREQAEVPEKAELIENELGTAPGFVFTREGRTFFILPGVPSEMQRMMEESVLPRLMREKDRIMVRSKLLLTTGIVESDLYEKIKTLLCEFPEVKLAFLPKTSGVVVRLMVHGLSAEENLLRAEARIRERVGKFIYGEGETTIEKVVADLLLKKKLTIAVAESCTGGLVSHKLTNVPGSSNYFNRGIVAYSNKAKVEVLGVPEKTIKIHGAVSPETALAMAEGVRRISKTDVGISTTGIAGPGGGTPVKPVGLVYIGYADSKRSFFEEHHFTRDRWWNKERSAITALDLVRRAVLGRVASK